MVKPLYRVLLHIAAYPTENQQLDGRGIMLITFVSALPNMYEELLGDCQPDSLNFTNRTYANWAAAS